MLTMYGPAIDSECAKRRNYAQTLIPMESVPALIPLIWILGDKTRKAWMLREEGIKAIKLLTFDA